MEAHGLQCLHVDGGCTVATLCSCLQLGLRGPGSYTSLKSWGLNFPVGIYSMLWTAVVTMAQRDQNRGWGLCTTLAGPQDPVLLPASSSNTFM